MTLNVFSEYDYAHTAYSRNTQNNLEYTKPILEFQQCLTAIKGVFRKKHEIFPYQGDFLTKI
jgi:hypothetical protein